MLHVIAQTDIVLPECHEMCCPPHPSPSLTQISQWLNWLGCRNKEYTWEKDSLCLSVVFLSLVFFLFLTGEPAIVWLTLVFTLLILIASICIKTKVMARGTNSRPLRGTTCCCRLGLSQWINMTSSPVRNLNLLFLTENVAVEKCKEWWRLVPSEKNKQHLRTPTSLDGKVLPLTLDCLNKYYVTI